MDSPPVWSETLCWLRQYIQELEWQMTPKVLFLGTECRVVPSMQAWRGGASPGGKLRFAVAHPGSFVQLAWSAQNER